MKSFRLNRLLQVKGRGECQWVECTGEYRVGIRNLFIYTYIIIINIIIHYLFIYYKKTYEYLTSVRCVLKLFRFSNKIKTSWSK